MEKFDYTESKRNQHWISIGSPEISHNAMNWIHSKLNRHVILAFANSGVLLAVMGSLKKSVKFEAGMIVRLKRMHRQIEDLTTLSTDKDPYITLEELDHVACYDDHYRMVRDYLRVLARTSKYSDDLNKAATAAGIVFSEIGRLDSYDRYITGKIGEYAYYKPFFRFNPHRFIP